MASYQFSVTTCNSQVFATKSALISLAWSLINNRLKWIVQCVAILRHILHCCLSKTLLFVQSFDIFTLMDAKALLLDVLDLNCLFVEAEIVDLGLQRIVALETYENLA